MGVYLAYPKYKDTGVEWFPNAPHDWDVLPARRVFKQVRDPANPEDEQLAATQKYGVIPQRLFMEYQDQKVVLALSGTGNFKHVERDDFVISLRSFQGGIERCHYEGCVSPAYTIMRREKDIESPYFSFLLKSDGFISALQLVTTGIREGKTITYEQFGSISVPFPSKSEQQHIANFLEHETAKIDRLIAKQERLIKLLNEKRQAVISHAVTKGLNPDATMKDSGVEWLGEVPAHWEVSRAKFVSIVFVPQRNKPELNEDDGLHWVTMEDIKGDFVDTACYRVSATAQRNAGSRILRAGSVIASCVGTFGVATVNRVDVIINQQLQAYIPERITPEYLREIIELSTSYFELVGTAATLTYVNQEGFDNLPVLIPSSEEQVAIMDEVISRKAEFNHLIELSERAISLLAEHRTALISAAVTGKIDVRSWQKSDTEETATAVSA